MSACCLCELHSFQNQQPLDSLILELRQTVARPLLNTTARLWDKYVSCSWSCCKLLRPDVRSMHESLDYIWDGVQTLAKKLFELPLFDYKVGC